MNKVINPCDFEGVANIIGETLTDNEVDFTIREVKIGPTRTAYDLTLKTEGDREKINDKFVDDLGQRLFPHEVTVEARQIYTSQRVRIFLEVGSELCDKGG